MVCDYSADLEDLIEDIVEPFDPERVPAGSDPGNRLSVSAAQGDAKAIEIGK